MAEPANTPESTEETPTPEVPEPAPVETPEAEAEDEFDKERAMATIRAQREKEKQLEADLKAARKAEAELQAIKDAEKTELERAQSEAEEAKATAERTRKNLEDANLKVALNGKVADVDLAATALKERGIEFDENGQPKDITEAVESLLTDKPLLSVAPESKRTPPPTDAGAGQGGGPGPSLNADQLAAAAEAGMNPTEYALIQKAIEEEGVVSGERWQQIQTQIAAAKT